MDMFVEVLGVWMVDRATGPLGLCVTGFSNPLSCPTPPSLLTSPELGLGRGREWTGLEGEVGVRLPSSGTLLYLGGRPG